MEQDRMTEFQISTLAFGDGGLIPVKYTFGGANVSPALSWSAPPGCAQSLVLMMEDPDAPSGTWYHWLMWNIPAHAGGIWEHVAPKGRLPGGMVQGGNSFGKMGYGGPCPPVGQTHRYIFKLYALDSMLDLPAGANYLQLAHAMRRHVKGETEWMGRCGR